MYISPLNEFIFIIEITIIVFVFSLLRSIFIPKPQIEGEPVQLKKSKNDRIVVFDAMRGIAILGVIVIHVTYLFPHEALKVNELFLQALDASFRFAMPIFYITSGILLTPPQKGYRNYFDFLIKRAFKILPAYVLVTLVLAISEGLTWMEFIKNIFTGSGSVPFYFIIVLFQLYIMYPFIADISKNRWFVFASFWFSFFFFFIFPTWYVLGIPTAFQFVFFFVWGIYMREQFLLGRLKKELFLWATLASVCVLMYALLPGQYYNTRLFYGPAIMVLLFMLFTSGKHFGYFENTLAWVGSISFWIFLTHFPIMEFILPMLWVNVYVTGYGALALSILVSIVVSIFFGFLCTKTYNSAVKVFSGKVRK